MRQHDNDDGHIRSAGSTRFYKNIQKNLLTKMVDNKRAFKILSAPTGWQRIWWLGPGFLWMVSAAGSGELLFTPRIGALYGYTLLWALILAVTFKWFINREIGRFTVCTGKPILEGFHSLPHIKSLALWIILVPQLFVAVTTIAGLAGSAATALVLMFPGDIRFWTIAAIFASTGLVFWGRYKIIEGTAVFIAVGLAISSVIAAVSVFPHFDRIFAGMIPQLPPAVDFGEVLPWLGFMLSGAAGMMWYSYWLKAKGYGMASSGEKADIRNLSSDDRSILKSWVTQMTLDNSVAVIGTLIVTLAFLILGTELLQPRGLVPEENKVAEIIGRLLGDIWGPVGFWFMVVSVFVGFWDTVLSNQDGFTRFFQNGTNILLKSFGAKDGFSNATIKNIFLFGFLTIFPILLYLIYGNPVTLLKLAGAIEASQIPIVAGFTLYLNLQLPADLRPSWLATIATILAALFFAGFAALYIFGL